MCLLETSYLNFGLFLMTLHQNLNSYYILKANLVVQERRLAAAMADLGEAQKVLDEKQAELDAVQATYDAAMKSKQVKSRRYFMIYDFKRFDSVEKDLQRF